MLRPKNLEQGKQPTIFTSKEAWREEWQGMPEFVLEDQKPWKQVIVSFATPEDMEAFAKLLGQSLTPQTRSIWYPKPEVRHMRDKRYVDEP